MGKELSKYGGSSLDIQDIIKVVVLGIVLYYAFAIVEPFIIPALWGAIIAIAFFPLVKKIESKFPKRRRVIIISGVLLIVMALLIPSYLLSESIITSSKILSQNLKDGTVVIPAPNESVKSWPVVGEKIYTFWNGVAQDLEKTIVNLRPQFSKYAGSIASAIVGVLGGVLQFAISVFIAAAFLLKSEDSVEVCNSIAKNLVGDKGTSWANLSALTIRSVVQGVIGISLLQAILAYLGFVLISVPFAWVWAFIVLFLAIIQLSPLIIMLPIIAYVFSYSDPVPATLFTIYMLIVYMANGVIKPFVLARGVDIPMLIILVGAIGGMMLSGILGLFIGAVILALAYKLFIVWLDDNTDAELAKV